MYLLILESVFRKMFVNLLLLLLLVPKHHFTSYFIYHNYLLMRTFEPLIPFLTFHHPFHLLITSVPLLPFHLVVALQGVLFLPYQNLNLPYHNFKVHPYPLFLILLVFSFLLILNHLDYHRGHLDYSFHQLVCLIG